MQFFKKFSFIVLLLICKLTHSATIAEIKASAKAGDIVSLQGQVTGQSPYHFSIEDETGGFLLAKSNNPKISIGDYVSVVAELRSSPTIRSTFALCRKIERKPASTKPPSDLLPSDLLSPDKFEYRCVRLHGVVTEVFDDEIDPGWGFLFIEANGCQAIVPYSKQFVVLTEPDALIDAKVAITGIFSPVLPGSRHYTGPYLFLFDRSDLVIEEPAPADPFSVPSIKTLPSISAKQTIQDSHRKRIDGRVIATWNGDSFFLQTDSNDRIRVQLKDGYLPCPGERVSVAGFFRRSSFFVKMLNSYVRRTANSSSPRPDNICTPPWELLEENRKRGLVSLNLDGEIIRVSGKVIYITHDRNKQQTMTLDCDGKAVEVVMGKITPPPPGSVIELTGACLFIEAPTHDGFGFPRLASFSLIPRDPDDIKIIRLPSWWTPGRLFGIILILVCLVIGFLIWNRILQCIVSRRSRELVRVSAAKMRNELRVSERMRLAVELHDSIAQDLTGVSMQLDAVEQAYRENAPETPQFIELTRRSLNSCCTELRNCLFDLRNNSLEETNIDMAIRRAISTHVGEAEVNIKLPFSRQRIPDATFHSMLSIIRELTVNALRHGEAKHIWISGDIINDVIQIEVKDDGCGFDTEHHPGPNDGHFGLQGINERLLRIGGSMTVSSEPKKGTIFKVSISI